MVGMLYRGGASRTGKIRVSCEFWMRRLGRAVGVVAIAEGGGAAALGDSLGCLGGRIRIHRPSRASIFVDLGGGKEGMLLSTSIM